MAEQTAEALATANLRLRAVLHQVSAAAERGDFEAARQWLAEAGAGLDEIEQLTDGTEKIDG